MKALLFLLVLPLLATAQSLDRAKRLAGEQNHREAADLLQSILASPKTNAPTTAQALSLLADCLDTLENYDELEKAVEKAVQQHPADARVLLAAAQAFGKLPHNGQFIGSEFVRHEDGEIETNSRDCIRVMQWLSAAAQAKSAITPKERVEMLFSLYEALTEDLPLSRFSQLTDIQTLPDFGERDDEEERSTRYPCDAAGNPVFFAVPASWEAAKNDGERVRWLFEQINQLAPDNARVTGALWAKRLHAGLQTTATGKSTDELRSLAVDEAWTHLASGLRRFRLPPDHAFLPLCSAFLSSPLDEERLVLPGGVKVHDLEGEVQHIIHHELLGRSQLSALVAELRSWMKHASKEDREWLAEEIDLLTGGWGSFVTQAPQPAGTKARLLFGFRNAKEVTFTARKIDVTGILAETEERLSKQEARDIKVVTSDETPEEASSPHHMRSIGTRLLLRGGEKFLSKPVAEWKVALQPASHHEDATTTITTPLSEAGAYFIEAKLTGGHGVRCVLWIESITMVATPVAEGMHYFLADAITGAPVAGAKLNLFGFLGYPQKDEQPVRRLTLKTSADGTATLPGAKIERYNWLVRVQLEDGRETHLGFEDMDWSEGDSRLDLDRLFIITDRPVYRPRQKVSWHAWAKRVGFDPKLETNAYAQRDCRVTITGPRRDKLIEQELRTDEHGAVSGSITLAESALLGDYEIEIEFEGRRELSERQSFKVEEYKKPDFAVKVAGPTQPVVLGEEIEFVISAEYYFGGAVKGGEVLCQVFKSERVDRWRPTGAWDWLYHNDDDRYDHSLKQIRQIKGVLDENGVLRVRLPTDAEAESDLRYMLQAEVTDVSRRVIAGAGAALASKKPFEALITLDRGWYASGATGTISVSAHTLNGGSVKAKGSLKVFHGGKAVQAFAVDLRSKTEFRLLWPQNGSYRLELALQDEKDREVKTTKKTFVRGAEAEMAAAEFEGLEVEVEKEEYQPGDEVRMLIHTQKPGSTVVLFMGTKASNGGEPVVLRLEKQTNEFRFHVTTAHQPNLHWAAYSLRDLVRHEKGGEILIPPVERIMKVELKTDAPAYGPRGNCRVLLTARDSAGKPVRGRLVLTAYDKALEFISDGSNVKSIIRHFWGWQQGGHFYFQDTLRWLDDVVRLDHDRNYMPYPEVGPRVYGYQGFSFDGISYPLSAHPAPPVVSAERESEPAEEAVMIRSQFADSAAWRQEVETNEKGEATVEFPFPDNLTTWKLKAWVMGPRAEVGEAEVEVITRKDLLVRLQSPRFFVEKDEVLLSAIVHNDHDTVQSVETTLKLENGTLEPLEPLSAMKCEIPAHDKKRLEWRVRAKTAGEALIRVSARSKAGSDAMELSFPVRVRGAECVETKSLFLAADETSRKWTFEVPEARRVASTRCELRCTTSLLPTIVEALPPLIEFPHGCAEQTLNRFVPAVVAVDAMTKLGLKHPIYTEAKARELTRAGLARLKDMRRPYSDSWSWFPSDPFRYDENPYMTALVVRGLQLARYAGVKEADELIEDGIKWLKRQEQSALEFMARPKSDRWYKEAINDTDVLVHAALITEGTADAKMRGLLFDQRARLSRQMLALLGLCCHHAKEAERRDMCLRNLRQHVQQDEATQSAWVKLPAERWWCWENDPIETQAAFLRLLLAANPKDELAPRVVKHLLQSKRHTTHWNSTRDTAAAIHALATYAQVTRETREACELELVLDGEVKSRTRLDAQNVLAGGHELVLEAESLPTGRHTLEIRKTGAASLYATGALTLFSQEETLPAAGLEIQTQRRFFRVEDRKRTEIASDTPLRSGDLVEVELTLESKHDAEYLLVEDFKPAGFESVSVRSGWSKSGLPCYQEFRDEKVCLYVEQLPQGRHVLRYHVRAETPGRFTALPAQVSAMYAPDLRANSADWRARVAE